MSAHTRRYVDGEHYKFTASPFFCEWILYTTIYQVSESAAKEYQIEEALTKMEGEWTGTRLEIVGYRETGTGVLKGVDEINTVLDEQVIL